MNPPSSRKGKARRVHFSGIGGTAMVSGARLAIESGWEVRGSDKPLYPPTSNMVAELGVPVADCYAGENLDWGPELVVIGNALSRGNPEVEAVLERRLPYMSLPEWLKTNVLQARRPIVIAGTHGKTTTSALAAYLLERSGKHPGYLVGGQLLDFEHAARLGKAGAPFVIEGDEYDSAFFDKRAKFLHYLPETAVVTSVEFDHGDIYRDIEEIELAFQRLMRPIAATGLIILCADSPRAVALRDYAFSEVETYGLDGPADWHGEAEGVEGGLQRLRVTHRGRTFGTFDVPLLGRHNLRNTLAAIAVAHRYGVKPEQVAEALPQFLGVRRRMEVFHRAGRMSFIDDFAHHPTAVAETIQAARKRWPSARLVAVFDPRTNTTRTNQFQDALREGLSAADTVWIGPIHRAEELTDEERLDRAALVRSLVHAGTEAQYTDAIGEIVAGLEAWRGTETVVLFLSNGAFGGIYEQVRERFLEIE